MIQINTEFDRRAYLSNSLKYSNYTAKFLKDEVLTLNMGVKLEISEEGMEKIQSGECRKEHKEEELRRYNPFETRELEDELYMSMLHRSGEQLKGKNYDIQDVMKATMDAYAQEYDRIIKDHESGDRRVNYTSSGEWDITLDEELEKLDEAFQRRLNDMDAFIGVKQLNEKVKLTPIYRQLQKRLSERLGISYTQKLHNVKTIDPENSDALEHSYNESAVAMMKEAQRVFLERYKSGNNFKGMASGIVSGLMFSDSDFMRKTHTLYG